jgi:hypothetical protein
VLVGFVFVVVFSITVGASSGYAEVGPAEFVVVLVVVPLVVLVVVEGGKAMPSGSRVPEIVAVVPSQCEFNVKLFLYVPERL